MRRPWGCGREREGEGRVCLAVRGQSAAGGGDDGRGRGDGQVTEWDRRQVAKVGRFVFRVSDGKFTGVAMVRNIHALPLEFRDLLVSGVKNCCEVDAIGIWHLRFSEMQ